MKPARIIPVLLLLLLVAAAWLRPLDGYAEQEVEAGMKRALASFAAARAMNAVISAAQGTEVGIGVISLAPGQLLDPVNDLVEQFSTLMLYATASFGIQRVLIEVGSHWLPSAVLSIVALWWAVVQLRARVPGPWLARLLLLVLLLRFAVPVATLGSELMYRVFLADSYASAQQGIVQARDGIAALGAPEEPAEIVQPAERGSFGLRWPEWASRIDPRQRIHDLQAQAEQAIEQLIDLIVVFLLQTLILPLAFLWLMLACGRWLLAWPVQPRRTQELER